MRKLTELSRFLGKELEDWETTHSGDRRKGETGDVGVEKLKEWKEGEFILCVVRVLDRL